MALRLCSGPASNHQEADGDLASATEKTIATHARFPDTPQIARRQMATSGFRHRKQYRWIDSQINKNLLPTFSDLLLLLHRQTTITWSHIPS
jgi:hypothetical protein